MKKGISNNSGVTMVLFAIAATLIMGFAALTIDVGYVMVERQKLHNAVDAATLAAAYELPNTNNAINVANEYMELNGFDDSYIDIHFSNNDRSINVTASKNIDFFFAKTLGFRNMSTTLSSGAELSSLGGAFEFVLFSGSDVDTLALNGSNFFIDGNTHTNNKFSMNGSSQTITGVCEAVSTVKTNGSNIDIGLIVPNAPFVEMPDFSDIIKLQAQESGNTYSGNKSYNGSNINVDDSIFVGGNLSINGSRFAGEGCILAGGDITFNGSNLTQSSDDAVCFYSENGDITINGSNAEIHGIIYAPNGTITFNGSNQSVNGRVIGNKVRINGSSTNIIGGTTDLLSLPSHGVKLTK